jgi:membrane-associated phospholipid phosphatase
VPTVRDRAVVVGSLAAFLGGAAAVRRVGTTPSELRWFERLNALPHRGYPLVWAPMQLGSLAGPLLAGAALAAAGRRRPGARVAAVGALTWVAAKLVKPLARRARPAHSLPGTRVLGTPQSGLGYPSGHAAVAVAVAAAASPDLPHRWRPATWAWALAVGPMRSYVGAHLPLDVAGGVALGLAIGTAGRRRVGGRRGGRRRQGSRSTPRSSRSSWRSCRRG